MENEIIKILEKKINEIKTENPKINTIIQEFDNLDYKPNNQVKNLGELIDLI